VTPGLPEALRLRCGWPNPLEGNARAGLFIDQEQKARLRADCYLRVIAGGLQFAVSLKERGVKFVSTLEPRPQYRAPMR